MEFKISSLNTSWFHPFPNQNRPGETTTHKFLVMLLFMLLVFKYALNPLMPGTSG